MRHQFESILDKIKNGPGTVLLSSDDKQRIGKVMNTTRKSRQFWVDLFGLSLHVLKKYKAASANGLKIRVKVGRCSFWDELSKEEILNTLEKQHSKMEDLFMSQFNELLLREKRNTFKRLGKPCNDEISRSTVAALIKELDLRANVKPDMMTASRKKNILDFRFLTMEFVGLKAVTEQLEKAGTLGLLGNTDDSQKLVTEGNVACVFKLTRDKKGRVVRGQKARNSESENGKNTFAKFRFLIFKDGSVGPSVVCLADETLGPDQIVVCPVKTMSVTTGSMETGYVVYCQKRTLCDAFYKWYILSVLIPFYDDKRKFMGLFDEATGVYNLACCTFDGEGTQLLKILNDAEIQEALLKSNLILFKHGASRTSVDQPCDVGNCFRALKGLLKYMRPGK